VQELQQRLRDTEQMLNEAEAPIEILKTAQTAQYVTITTTPQALTQLALTLP